MAPAPPLVLSRRRAHVTRKGGLGCASAPVHSPHAGSGKAVGKPLLVNHIRAWSTEGRFLVPNFQLRLKLLGFLSSGRPQGHLNSPSPASHALPHLWALAHAVPFKLAFLSPPGISLQSPCKKQAQRFDRRDSEGLGEEAELLEPGRSQVESKGRQGLGASEPSK